MSELWIDKYKPQSIEELVGNFAKIKTMHEWLKNFNQEDSKKILLICGPPGIGKTTVAYILLKEFRYDPIEFNASTVKGSKNIKETISKMLTYRSIVDMLKHDVGPTGLIMDEIDSLCNYGDKGGMAEFLSIIKENKGKIKNPIICIYNEFSDKKLTELKKHSLEVKMTKPTDYDMGKMVDRITKKEKMKIDADAIPFIIKHAMGDIRRLINILYDIYLNYFCKKCKGVNTPKKIDIEKIEKLFQTFGKKDIDYQIFEATSHVLTHNLSIDEALRFYDMDKLLLPMMLHENYIGTIGDRKATDMEKLKIITNIAETLVDYDIVQTNMFENQAWELAEYAGVLSSVNINHFINSMEKSLINKNSIKYTTLLNKQSYYSTNKKLLVSLNSKLYQNSKFENLYFISEYLAYNLYNKHGKKINVIKVLKQYRLSIQDLEVLLRINKFNGEDIRKKFTTKIKNEIIGLMG